MTICAFDLSLCSTGWATYDGAITSGTLAPPKGITGMPRLEWIVNAVVGKAEKADVRIFEDLSFGSNDPSAQERAGLAYIIRFMLYPDLDWRTVAPSALKKFVTGKGNAKKEHMMLEVFKRFNLTAANNNEADALGLLHIGMALHGLWEPTIDAQREVLAKLRGKS